MRALICIYQILNAKKEYLSIIIEESSRLTALSSNSLNLSKIESQTILTDFSKYNLSEQIRNSILLFQTKWQAKNLDFQISLEEQNIKANEELLKQVWINLLDNAIKFSPPEKQIIFEASKNEENVFISIKNFGNHFSEEQKSRLFDKFYQGDESHSTNGNGLGLPMVKRIIDLHEGTITVENKNDDSVMFLVTLPLE